MKINVKQLFKSVPGDFCLESTRDIGLLTSAVFAESHFGEINKLFKLKFSSVFLYVKGGQTAIYRSLREYENFYRQLGTAYLRHPELATAHANRLTKLTDYFGSFVGKKNSPDFQKNASRFLENYRTFFAYHLGVCFGGEYLAQTRGFKSSAMAKKIFETLYEAYRYNELVVPKIESYLKKMGLDQLLPQEAVSGKNRSGKRSQPRSIFVSRARHIALSEHEGRALRDLIERRQSYQKTPTIIKGIGMGNTKIQGQVRLIKNLNNFDRLQKGEILVASITRPQYNFLIRRAGAIVTDTGGLLSHPAIIAREFRIPAVVNCQIATKVLKDGDLVEVDAEKGIVKKL